MLEPEDLPADPHLASRGGIADDGRRLHAAPAPRLSGHVTAIPAMVPATVPRADAARAVLDDAGFTIAEINALLAAGVVGAPA